MVSSPDWNTGARGRRDDRGDYVARRDTAYRGLKEKLLAAHRGEIKTVLDPGGERQGSDGNS